jgi:hypothetical protein
MTRATKIKKARQQVAHAKPAPRLPRGLLVVAAAGVAGLLAAGALLWNSSAKEAARVFTGVPFTDPGPIHVHGLGINPTDGSLFIATHTGLFRVGTDSTGKNVYGYDASNDRLLASADEGRTWKELDKPAPIVDLAPDPGSPQRLLTTAVGGLDQGMYASQNGGGSWKRLNYAVGLLAWPSAKRLYLVDDQGTVLASRDGGRTLERRGETGGEPAALLAVGNDELYVALHDGTIKRSTDAGSSWTVRSRP